MNVFFFSRLPVLFRSSLEHQVEWYSDKQKLTSSSDKYELSEDENGAYLLIKSVSESDAHEYELVISNQKEKMSFKTFLYVEGIRGILFFSPIFNGYYNLY